MAAPLVTKAWSCLGERCGHMFPENGQQIGHKPRITGLPPKFSGEGWTSGMMHGRYSSKA